LTAARRAGPILAALAAVAAFAALVFSQMDMRSDMADFLPAGQTEAARFMLQELRSGTATGLILVGIEDAPPPDLARISAGVAAALDRSGLFTIVSNSQQALDGPDGQVLFDSRYLLSPGTTVEAFTTESLHAGMERLLQGLQSSASPLVSRLGLPDPTGAFPALAQVWIGGSHVRTQDGVWFAPDRDRALLLAQTRAGGMDITAQDRVDAAIRDAFANASPGPARLLVSGPAVFARQAAHAIKADVEMLSVVSALLVAGLLWWRFRSPLVIAAIAVPITLGVAVAALVVQAAFGFVHGIAFGFGMTMLGVTVDYPVLLIGHRKAGEAAPGTLRRIGRAFAMAVATAALGLTGMVFSGFPGLSQLGLFSVVGVLTAAAATRFLLPRLIVAADLASFRPAIRRPCCGSNACAPGGYGGWPRSRSPPPCCSSIDPNGRATLPISAPCRRLRATWTPNSGANSGLRTWDRSSWCAPAAPMPSSAHRSRCCPGSMSCSANPSSPAPRPPRVSCPVPKPSAPGRQPFPTPPSLPPASKRRGKACPFAPMRSLCLPTRSRPPAPPHRSR